MPIITLRLPQLLSFEQVQQLPGLRDLPLDTGYGLVCISPRTHEYVVRTAARVGNLPARQRLSPEIDGEWSDPLASTTKPDPSPP
ncbi:hypothetical protein [Hymenobacter pini]|uniref:hypothetical protein n=1 Tax=Hymenobacter pini TaxID=2880879 RepID=UPI001CF14B9C|nr:hypothetical protein [Hymenobacter pini]MCA8832372.1 hypothetical protein [Hymenobacter pini]